LLRAWKLHENIRDMIFPVSLACHDELYPRRRRNQGYEIK
jgi:hypothetical protein